MVVVKPHVLFIVMLVGCTHTAQPLEEGCRPDRRDIVLSGAVSGGDGLQLKAATGRVYAVRARDARFVVTVPAGVYEIASIDGVRPAVPLSFNGIPGDRLDLGLFDVASGTVASRSTTTGASITLTRSAAYFGGAAHETPLRYYARTGSVVRPLPVPAGWGGGSRAGMGLGLRSR